MQELICHIYARKPSPVDELQRFYKDEQVQNLSASKTKYVSTKGKVVVNQEWFLWKSLHVAVIKGSQLTCPNMLRRVGYTWRSISNKGMSFQIYIICIFMINILHFGGRLT